MESVFEEHSEVISKLFTCERVFVEELLESGSTFETAMKLLDKQNETFGKPVVVKEITFKNGKVGKHYDWKTEE